MLSYQQALELAEARVRICSRKNVQITKVLQKPYRWVFYYQRSEHLATADRMKKLSGNAPFIVNCIGEIRLTGTAWPIDKYLSEYESTVPKGWLEMGLPNKPYDS